MVVGLSTSCISILYKKFDGKNSEGLVPTLPTMLHTSIHDIFLNFRLTPLHPVVGSSISCMSGYISGVPCHRVLRMMPPPSQMALHIYGVWISFLKLCSCTICVYPISFSWGYSILCISTSIHEKTWHQAMRVVPPYEASGAWISLCIIYYIVVEHT